MVTMFLPGAVFRPIKYRLEAGAFKGAPLGWVLHVADMDGSPFDVFQNAKSPNRRFSTAWVAKDGSSEQYTTNDMMTWAQASGNPWYWSIETEGSPDEPLTDPQILTLARFHNAFGTSDLIALRPGDHGIGTHYMGLSAWGAHSCPDPRNKEGKGPRSLQRGAIIKAAQTLRKAPVTAPVKTPTKAPVLRPQTPTAPRFPGTLRKGSKGVAVATFQKQLARRGWSIIADGDFGKNTYDTVVSFQSRKGLTPDGVVGPVTWTAFWTAK